jgi:hypothetical protein
MNTIRDEYSLDVPVSDCSSIGKTQEKVADIEFLQLRELVRPLNWDEGPRMELLKYILLPMNSGVSVFFIDNEPRGLQAASLFKLLKKVCDSDYPGDFIMGSACIYFGEVTSEFVKR